MESIKEKITKYDYLITKILTKFHMGLYPKNEISELEKVNADILEHLKQECTDKDVNAFERNQKRIAAKWGF